MALPLLALGLGASILGQGAGTIMSLRANKKQQRELNRRQQVLDAWFNKEYNQDYLSGTEAKSALRTVTENLKRQNKAQEGKAAMTGASDEAQVAGREAQARTYADFVNQLAAKGAARRDALQGDYMNQKNLLYGQQDQLASQRQQTYANIMSNAGNALSAASGAASLGNATSSITPSTGTSDLLNASGTLKSPGSTIDTSKLRSIPLLYQ